MFKVFQSHLTVSKKHAIGLPSTSCNTSPDICRSVFHNPNRIHGKRIATFIQQPKGFICVDVAYQSQGPPKAAKAVPKRFPTDQEDPQGIFENMCEAFWSMIDFSKSYQLRGKFGKEQ